MAMMQEIVCQVFATGKKGMFGKLAKLGIFLINNI
jgi:hypothetical protein